MVLHAAPPRPLWACTPFHTVSTLLWVVGCPALCLGQQEGASEIPLFRLGAGYYDVGGRSDAVEVHLEHRPNVRLLGFGPWILAEATSQRAGGLFMGVLRAIPLGRDVAFVPSTGMGLWTSGTGKNLGSVLEFRSTAEIAVRLDSGAWFGASVTHRSNAGLGSRNPGVNSFTLSYGIPSG